MAKQRRFEFTLSIGLQGRRKETVEYASDEFDGLTDDEIQARVDSDWKEWIWNYIDGGATEIEG